LGAHHDTKFIPAIGTGQPLHVAFAGRSAHASPHTTSGGILVSDQVRRTTVAPWSFRKPARKPVQKSGTRALRFVASACIPAGKLQRKRKHVSARTSCSSILQDRDRCGTARHYRQAKYDSQNPFTIASRDTSVNQTGTKAPWSSSRRLQITTQASYAGLRNRRAKRPMPSGEDKKQVTRSLAETVGSLYTEGFP